MGLNMPSPKTDLTADALSDRQRAAESVARYGGLLALALRADPRGLEIALKGPQDVVTMADGEVERSIIAALGAAFPDDAFLGEESGGTPGDHCWGIDPIDGTANFPPRLPPRGVAIAFVAAGRA